MASARTAVVRHTRPATQRKLHKSPLYEPMIAQIRQEVQQFANDIGVVRMNSKRLAPLIAAAYDQFIRDVKEGTKLDFCKLFAAEEQLAQWPSTDRQAKADGGPIASLFYSVENLLRQAGLMEYHKQLEEKKQAQLTSAETRAREEAIEQGLAGPDFEQYIADRKEQVVQKAVGRTAKRLTPESLVNIIRDGWFSDLDDWLVYAKLIQNILVVKYSSAQAKDIIARAVAQVTEIEAERVPAPQAGASAPEPATEPPVEIPSSQPATIQPAPEKPKETTVVPRRRAA